MVFSPSVQNPFVPSCHLYKIPSYLQASTLRFREVPCLFQWARQELQLRCDCTTHSPDLVWYPGGSRLFVMQLSGCETFRSSLDPGTRNLRLLCGLSTFIQTGSSLKHVCVPICSQLHFCLAAFQRVPKVSPARMTRRALELTSV